MTTSASAVQRDLPKDRKLQSTRWLLARRLTSVGMPHPFPSTVRCGLHIRTRSWAPSRPLRTVTTDCGRLQRNDDASLGKYSRKNRNGTVSDTTEFDYVKYEIASNIHSSAGNTTMTTMAMITIIIIYNYLNNYMGRELWNVLISQL